MAINQKVTRPAILRITGAARQRLEALLFSRYPEGEWGAFFLFGTHDAQDGIIVTVVDLIEPELDDLDSTTAIVRFTEPYSLRAALEKQKRGLCVGVIHSHPQNCGVRPSLLDDDMDRYYRDYFSAFGQQKAYFSLIFSKNTEGDLRFAGRGWRDGREFRVEEMVTVHDNEIRREAAAYNPSYAASKNEFRARFEEIYGADAAARLRKAHIAIIGASGTGSPAAHVLARAGVENFILIDPQRLAKSNLERVHGSYETHFANGEEEAAP